MLALRHACCLCRFLKRSRIGHTVRQFSRSGNGQETGMFTKVFKADGNMPLRQGFAQAAWPFHRENDII